jgi:hypothetical protein
MSTNKTFVWIVFVALLLSACGTQSTPITPTLGIPNTGSDSIGTIDAEETLVESGLGENLVQVTQSGDFFNNSTVRVTNGGVAKLDFFANQISIRLFNDTAVGNVRADPSGTPDRAVRMKLAFGGLSGEVTKNGIPVQFEITNGVNIYILGTQFLVLYDPETSTTYVANFDGTIAYTLPGQQAVQFIPAGQLYEVSPNFEINKFTLNFTRADIDNLTSSRRSTLLVTLRDYLEPPATPTPTATPTTTATLSPTPSPTITPTPTKIIPCDQAAFVADVTIPDGTSFSPSFQFTKTWRLRNVGSCTWTNNYSLVFYSGEQMSGKSVSMPSTVAPGQTVDIAVDLAAPALPGSYRGDWMVRSSSGALFGAGANGTTPIWVKINVVGSPDLTTMITADPNPDCSTSQTCTTTIAFVITNAGSVGVTSSFQVLIEANDIPSKTITVDGLAAGTSQNFSEVLNGFCYTPDCTVRVTVDPGNVIQESNETNNVAELTVNG